MVPSRLWVYTNFDCNLRCSYCLSSSYPGAPRRAISLSVFQRLVQEAAEAGIKEVFLTGGEPFLLPDIGFYITAAVDRLSTTVLSNGVLINGRRLQQLLPLRDRSLTLQVSLDGHTAGIHEAYRGRGTWRRTVQAIQRLVDHGFHVAVGATETPVNRSTIPELAEFVASLGIGPEDFFVRPLTRRGLSLEGLDLTGEQLVPELTVTAEGAFWHPQSGGETLLVSRSLFPLREVIDIIEANYQAVLGNGPSPRPYRCA